MGDVFFQQKCFERFRELRERGCTILLVSHDMEAITHLCDRAILLSAGKCASEGDARSVVHDYFALRGQAVGAAASPARRRRRGRTAGDGQPAGRDPRGGAPRAGAVPLPGTPRDKGNGGARSWASPCPTPLGQPGVDGRHRAACCASGTSSRRTRRRRPERGNPLLRPARHPRLCRGDGQPRLSRCRGSTPASASCARSRSTLALAPGEYTLLPQIGGPHGRGPRGRRAPRPPRVLAPDGGDAGGLRGLAALLWAHRSPRRVRVERRRRPTRASER